MDIDNITSIKSLTINRNQKHTHIILSFFMLLAEKSPIIFHKHNGYTFISGFFALEWYIFVALTNKKTIVSIIMKIQTKFSI